MHRKARHATAIVSPSFSFSVYNNHPFQPMGPLRVPYGFFVHRFVYQFQITSPLAFNMYAKEKRFVNIPMSPNYF